ncbi:MAG: hypothetical protein GXO57_06840 [Thermodesulfobacteria bacterium]|nr:hypothetical protein [Thermodesulfobacteriota bacterium]
MKKLLGSFILACSLAMWGCSSTSSMLTEVVSKIPTIGGQKQATVQTTTVNATQAPQVTVSYQSANAPTQIYVYGSPVPIKVTATNELCKALPESFPGCKILHKCISAISKVDGTKFGNIAIECGKADFTITLVLGNQATNIINDYRVSIAQTNSNIESFSIQGHEAGFLKSDEKAGTVGVIVQENPDEVLMVSFTNATKEQAIDLINKFFNINSLIVK